MARDLNNRLYVGITKDLDKRIYCHNKKQGSLFTKSGIDFKIVFNESYNTLIGARRREMQIKKWRRDKKEFLIKKHSLGLATKL